MSTSNLAIFNKKINDTRTQNYLQEVLKDKKESFVTSLVSVVANNTALQACEPLTIMYAAMKATALSLPIDPNLGFAYVIPYKNKGVDEAQFQLGYKGFIQLAMRSGQFQSINADAVYEGEISRRDKKSGDIELEGERISDKVVGYFAYFKLLNGFEKTLYMTVDEVKAHANRFSQTAKRGYGLWNDKEAFDAMARKTVMKMLLSKFAPMSIESIQSAVKADQAVYRTEDMVEDYVDNQQGPDEQMAAEIVAKAEESKKKVAKAMEVNAEEIFPEE